MRPSYRDEFEDWTLFEFEDGSREWHRLADEITATDVNEYASGLMIGVLNLSPPAFPKAIRTVRMPRGVWRGTAD